MLFDNHATQTAEASLDALWLKAQVITNNIANVETPGFKASTVTFEEVLRRASSGDGKTGAKICLPSSKTNSRSVPAG